MYGFMLNVQKSNNLILNSIVHCDIVCASSRIRFLPVHPARSSRAAPHGRREARSSCSAAVELGDSFL